MIEYRERVCPICSKNSERIYVKERFDPSLLDSFSYASRKFPEYMLFRMALCQTCDLAFVSHIPEKITLQEQYHEAAFDSGEEAQFAARTYKDLVKSIESFLPDKSSMLDIGTGEGSFLVEMKEIGFENVTGVEPSENAIQQASPQIAKYIQKGFFDPKQFSANSFSLISCFQTLEHLEDPSTLLKNCLNLLKPGGVFLTVCHNRNAWSAKVLRTKSPIFDVEHLQLFSSSSINKLFDTAGYSKSITQPLINRYPLHYWFKLFPMPNRVKKQIWSMLKKSKIGNIPVPLPAGNMFTFGVK